ncbi:fimbria/pilus outer membrane usher protein [Wohlfahrtiimonas larvae]|uniref:fimbria/pilus outer membrane usher protein n=1 Tax=Wohlfahrtiimonas larvae TaxID=1157986 RepID=UPI00117C9F5A|nr:fimbria/pilus outer membrane usher protein [Wohlfahrtiimonas larvae]
MDKLLYKKVLVVALGGVLSSAVASTYTFDSALLESLGMDSVDLTAFSGENEQFSGEYLVTFNINNTTVDYSKTVFFYMQDDQNILCVTKELASELPLKDEALTLLYKTEAHETDVGLCYSLESLDSAVAIDFDSSAQIVNITMPQMFLENYDSSWLMPRNRDYGIAGIIMDYSLLGTFSRSKNGGKTQSFDALRSYGVVGFNIDRLRFRAKYEYDSKGKKKIEWDERYVFMDVASLNAKLYAGELYSRSNVFDSVRFKGVSLFSDESMMPSYLQGYSPQITGTVSSNAIVTIKQNGSIIRSEQVTPGPFAISDLPSYITGTVDVEIEENNGQKYTYQVDIARVPFLTRKNDIRYNVNIGKLSPKYRKEVNSNFVSFDTSYGLTNNVSVYGGAILTSNSEYKSYNLGVGMNLEQFGAVSFDVTSSETALPSHKTLKGHSYRVNYAKRFSSSLMLNLAGYRFSSRDFRSLNNYIDMKSNSRNTSLEKNRFTLSMTQSFPSIATSVTASITKGSYWNQKNMSSYNISANKIVKDGWFENTNINLSFSRHSTQNGKNNNQVGLYVNIPLEKYDGTVTYSSQFSNPDRSLSNQATYSTYLWDGRASITAENRKNKGESSENRFSTSYNLETSRGTLRTSTDYTSDYQSATVGFDGSITLTQHGIATHPKVYDDGSRLLIDTGVSGVRIRSSTASSNLFGMIGISNIPNYYESSYSIDNDNLPDNVEIENSVVKSASTDGAILYKATGAVSGEKSISTITLDDGSYPPFGAVVYRENGHDREVGMIAENGLTYLSGLNSTSKFIVKWSDQECSLKIDSLDTESLRNLQCRME